MAFCGVYENRPTEAEICGMVHPAHRRQHIASRLLDAAVTEVRGRGVGRVLLIVERSFASGAGFAKARGGELDFSECRMCQSKAPELQGAYEQLRLRPARRDDVDFLRDCVAQGFQLSEEAVARTRWAERVAKTLVIEHAGVPVGVMRVERDEEAAAAGIYGFAVQPERQGRGYGRGALSRVTRALRDEGIGSVHLEVRVDHPAALHLYESCGFVASGVEDYYLLAS